MSADNRSGKRHRLHRASWTTIARRSGGFYFVE